MRIIPLTSAAATAIVDQLVTFPAFGGIPRTEILGQSRLDQPFPGGAGRQRTGVLHVPIILC